jgi:hypothetical protein
VTPFIPPIASWGCSHGSGFLGTAIRRAEEEMSRSAKYPDGDHRAAWAGHCFVFVGNQNLNGTYQPCIVEAESPRVVLSPITAHPDACWAFRQPLTAAQRKTGQEAVLAMVGQQYDWLAYAYFLAKAAHVLLTKDLSPLFTAMAKIGPICSGVVVRLQEAMKVDLGQLRVAAVQDPDFICPADVLQWGLDNNWLNTAPAADWK